MLVVFKNRTAVDSALSARPGSVDSPVVTSQLPAAVLWDMDGTIVDTEPYWMSAETHLVESFGGSWSHEEALTLVGQGLWHSARILQAKGVELSEDEIIATLTARVADEVRREIPWRPGALDLIRALHERRVPMAIVTMSLRSLAEVVAERVGFDAFSAIVSGDDVEHSKPHPEPYLTGAAALGVTASACVAFEDSAPGLASAVTSGAVTIGVPHMVPLESGPTHTIWQSLEGKTLDDIADVFARSNAS